jgi:multiple sugar transport system substrate-binding protein
VSRGARRLAAILLAVLLLLPLPDLASAQRPRLRLWLLRTYVPDANQQLEATVAEWSRSRNVEVAIEYFTFDDIETKYVAAIETNSLPDVGQLQTISPARYRGMGRLQDVTDVVDAAVKANGPVLDTALPATRFGGRFYAAPFAYLPGLLFVRTDLFKKAGVPYPKTWDEVREAATRLKSSGVMEYPLGQSWNRSADGYGVFQALLYSHGGGWADAEGNYAPIVNDTWRATLRWATEIYTKDRTVPPDAMAWSGFGNNEAFLAGKIAMTFNGPSIHYVLEKEKRPLLNDTLMLVMPAGPAGRNHDVFLLSFGVFAGSRQTDLAKDLVRFLLSPEEAGKYMRKSWGQMVPVFDRLRRDPYWQQSPSYRAALEAPRFARPPGFPGPVTPAAAEVVATNVLTDLCARVIVEGWDIDRALQEADRRIRDIYATVPSR